MICRADSVSVGLASCSLQGAWGVHMEALGGSLHHEERHQSLPLTPAGWFTPRSSSQGSRFCEAHLCPLVGGFLTSLKFCCRGILSLLRLSLGGPQLRRCGAWGSARQGQTCRSPAWVRKSWARGRRLCPPLSAVPLSSQSSPSPQPAVGGWGVGHKISKPRYPLLHLLEILYF